MNKTIKFDYSKAVAFMGADELQNFKTITLNARDTLLSKSGAGADFLGWIDLPIYYDKNEFERIKAAAKNTVRLRCTFSGGNRWLISWSKSCHRVFDSQLLQLP